MIGRFVAFLTDDSGATLTEYGVITASLSLSCIAGLLLVAGSANSILQSIFNGMSALEIQCPGSAC